MGLVPGTRGGGTYKGGPWTPTLGRGCSRSPGRTYRLLWEGARTSQERLLGWPGPSSQGTAAMLTVSDALGSPQSPGVIPQATGIRGCGLCP